MFLICRRVLVCLVGIRGCENFSYICGVMGKTWCHTRRKSELCVHEMSLWNRNRSKTGRKAFYW